MTEQEEFEFRLRLERERAPTAEAKPFNPADTMSRTERVLAGAGKTMTDVALGAKQRWDEAAAGLERFATGGKGTTAAGILDATNKQAAEKKRLDAGIANDGWGMAGSVGAGALLAAPLAPAGALAAGAATGYLQPTTGGMGEVATNTALGGATAFAGEKALNGLARMIKPNTRPDVTNLLKEGVRPTVGQTLGGNFAKVEEKAMSLPFVGDAISGARGRATADLNTAAVNRALSPVGEKAPAGLVGRDAVEYVSKTLGAKYDTLLPKLTVQADAQFTAELGNLRQMVATGAIDPKFAKAFDRVIKNDVLSKFQGQNALTGQTMKQIEGDLGARASQLAQSTDADARLMADALREAQSVLRGVVERSNPAMAKELKAINTGWANFKRLERAAAGLGAEDGVFSAAQLQNAVKALDKSKDKARFSRGEALMQDLSEPAKNVLGAKVPDSGTAGRLMNAGALAAGAANPMVPIGMMGGAGLYSAPVQNALVSLLTKRPEGAAQVAAMLRRGGPMVNAFAAGSSPLLIPQ